MIKYQKLWQGVMMLPEKILALVRKHRDFILYVVFGVLTTAVNYAVYFPLTMWTPIYASVSNVIAWTVSVAFAFVTNKPFVFQSHDWSWKVVFPEAWKFVGCRIGSGLVETVFLLITVDWLCWDANWMKIIICVVVILMNYLGSKIIFKQKNN